MRLPSINRKASLPLALLGLAALACLCGPLSLTGARDTAGTAEAVATGIGEAAGTLEIAVTSVPTGEAALASRIAPIGPTLRAGIAEFQPTLAAADLEEYRQWGLSAMASSQRAGLQYAAAQATGPPNTTECGEAETAWASLEPNTQEELTIIFAEPVIPLQVIIHESYNPGFVTQVRLVDVFGNTPIVYQANPQLAGECPRSLTVHIPLNTAAPRAGAVIISLDQTTAPSWAQIDAVELVGAR
jgi:hypothetical protein